MKHFAHLATRVFNTPLLIQHAKLEAILGVFAQRMESGGAPPVEAVAGDDRRQRKSYGVTKDGFAVISIVGPLVKRASGSFLSGGPTTYGEIENEFMDAATDPDIKGILLDMDSPGGEVGGLFELADMIHGQRGAKPIYAVANDDCYSAAYAIASAAERIYITRAGGVGSIGVIAMHCDQSALDAGVGLKYTAIFAGARKKDFNPHEPLSEAATAALQAEIDRLYGLFSSMVARNRKLSMEQVASTEAGLFFGQNALAAGLADFEGTLEDAARDMLMATQGARSTNLAADAAQITKEASMPEEKTEATATAAAAPPIDVTKLTTEAEARGFDAASEIAQLCQIAGKPAMAVEFITKKMSIPDVRNALIAARAEAYKIQIDSRSTAVNAGVIASVDAAAAEIARSTPGLTKENATVRVINANPKLYDQYLQANPAQTGARQ